jgi:GT2 family glycosyltransferase
MDSLGSHETLRVAKSSAPQCEAVFFPNSHSLGSAAHATPKLSVVLVNYRQWDQTALLSKRLCQGRLVKSGLAEVVIVDNHSGPHRKISELRRRDGISIRRWGANQGFARAVNEGVRLSRGEWVLLLNPDMTALPGFLEAALSAAEQLAAEEPRAGIVGLGLLNPEGTQQRSTGPFPTLSGTLWRRFLPRSLRKYHMTTQGRRTVPWTSGCCILIRRACLEDVGGLDGDFFLYYEDVDLCLRAWKAGWQVWHEPAVCLTHHAPLHRRRVPQHLQTVTRHALMLFAHKHWPAWQRRVLFRIMWLEAVAQGAWGRDPGKRAGLSERLKICRLILAGKVQESRRVLEALLAASPSPYLREDARAA